jgi:hypothetical protein
MILLVFAALLGASITLAALWPYGALVALIAVPFGGSTAAAVAGAVLALRTFDPGEHGEYVRDGSP